MTQQQQALPDKIRSIFEQYGVIKRIAVPKLDLLDKAIADRKGKWELSKTPDGFAVAKVTIHGSSFDGTADESNMALSLAFAQALKSTEPYQSGLFDEEDDDPPKHQVSSVTISSGTRSVTLTKAGDEILADYAAHEGISIDEARDRLIPYEDHPAGCRCDVCLGVAEPDLPPVDLAETEATPEEMAATLRDAGIPVYASPDGYADPDGNLYDGPDGHWVKRESQLVGAAGKA